MKNNSQNFCWAILMLALSVVACSFNFGGSSNNSRADDPPRSTTNTRRETTRETTTTDNTPPRTAPPAADKDDSSGPSETARPTSISGGQEFVWNGHGVSIVVPSNWKKRTSNTGQVSFGETGGASISVDEIVAKPGPVTESFVTSDYSFQQKQKSEGKVEEAKYLTIDGVRGSFARSAAGDSEYSSRKISWKGFRTYQGRPQAISVLLLTTQKEYAANRDTMEQVLYNIKFTE